MSRAQLGTAVMSGLLAGLLIVTFASAGALSTVGFFGLLATAGLLSVGLGMARAPALASMLRLSTWRTYAGERYRLAQIEEEALRKYMETTRKYVMEVMDAELDLARRLFRTHLATGEIAGEFEAQRMRGRKTVVGEYLLREEEEKALATISQAASEAERDPSARGVFHTAMETAVRSRTLEILVVLSEGGTRFAELEGAVPDITPRALSLRLRQLEDEGLIEKVVSSAPTHVTYSLSEKGIELTRAINALKDWALQRYHVSQEPERSLEEESRPFP
jgi:DNA-binding HxlR family transcriptional regulator